MIYWLWIIQNYPNKYQLIIQNTISYYVQWWTCLNVLARLNDCPIYETKQEYNNTEGDILWNLWKETWEGTSRTHPHECLINRKRTGFYGGKAEEIEYMQTLTPKSQDDAVPLTSLTSLHVYCFTLGIFYILVMWVP